MSERYKISGFYRDEGVTLNKVTLELQRLWKEDRTESENLKTPSIIRISIRDMDENREAINDLYKLAGMKDILLIEFDPYKKL